MDESPVIVPSGARDLASSRSEDELDSNVSTEPIVDQTKESLDGISELDTIRDDGSITPGEGSEFPQIVSSVSPLTVIEADEAVETATLDMPSSVDSSFSQELSGQTGGLESDLSHDLSPEQIAPEVEQSDLEMPQVDIVQAADSAESQNVPVSELTQDMGGNYERELSAAMNDRLTAPVVAVVDSGVDVGEADVQEIKPIPALETEGESSQLK